MSVDGAPGDAPERRRPPASPKLEPNRGEAAQEVDIFAKIERLAELQQRGIVSPEEFAAKKAELLSRLDALFWRSAGFQLKGWLFAVSGKSSDAVQMITSRSAAKRITAAMLFEPLMLSSLAWSHAQLAHFEDAWRCMDDATGAIEKTKERWYEAEVYRIAGEIALKSPDPDAAKAEACFERALSVARAQQAKSWELRAAMSLARTCLLSES